MNLPSFQPTLLALPQVAAVVISSGLALRLWKKRTDSAGAKELIIAQGFTVLWSLLGALEFCAATLEAKIFFSQLSYIGIVGAPWALFRFAHAYTGVQTPLPRWFFRISLTWAGLILLAVFTNRHTGLIWAQVVPIEIHGEFFARYDRGPAFWVNIIYGYGLTLASCVLFIRHAVDLGGIYRRQSIITTFAILCPWLTSLAYLLRLGPLPEIDNTPVGFALANLLFTWNLLRWGFFDLAPVATRTLFARMAEPVLVADHRRRLSQANPAAFDSFHLGPADIGAPLSDALARHPEILKACLSPGTTPLRQTVADHDRWWNIEVTALASPRGAQYGRLCVLHDITDLVEARQAAERAHHVKAEFLAHVSHDLRTPLHSILVLSEILQAGPLKPDQQARLGTLREAGQSLLRLVNDLLDMNRIESGQIDLANTPFRLDDVLLPVAELLRLPARRKGLELSVQVEAGFSGRLRGDPDRLRQILFNLGGNAVKFTDHGHILLRAGQPRPGVLRLEVADTGPGLPSGLESSLFSPFVRAPSARKTEGSGLGLSIVRRLAEAMGGAASAANGPAGGSVFAVELPIVDETAAATPVPVFAPCGSRAPFPEIPAGDTLPRAARHPRLRVLLVDDDTRSLAASTALLQHCDQEVETSNSAEEALAILAQEPFALVVMDGQLPGLDGIEATRRIRAFAAGHPNQGIPVLGLTADPSPTRNAQWRAAGAFSVLAKPSGTAEFTAALAAITSNDPL